MEYQGWNQIHHKNLIMKANGKHKYLLRGLSIININLYSNLDSLFISLKNRDGPNNQLSELNLLSNNLTSNHISSLTEHNSGQNSQFHYLKSKIGRQ